MTNPLKIEFDKKRVYGLDILRAVAILAVILSHGEKLMPAPIARAVDATMPDGVFLFFILSGFLIGGMLIKIVESQAATLSNLFSFWIRRWFRTLPNYLLILTLLIVLHEISFGAMPTNGVYHYYLFIQNFHTAHPVFFSEAWTLSVEEWFYLLIPSFVFLLISVFKVAPKKAIVRTAVAVLVASVSIRLVRYIAHPPTSVAAWDMYYRKEVVTRLDSLMVGVLGAYYAFHHRERWLVHKKPLFIAGLSLVIFAKIAGQYIASGNHILNPALGLYMSVFSFEFTALGVLAMLPLLSDIKSGKGFIYQALTYVSITSYSMYLIHVSLVQPFAYSLTKFHVPVVTALIRYGLYWGMTIVGSILLYKFFEKPTMDLRERFMPKKHVTESKAVPVPAAAD